MRNAVITVAVATCVALPASAFGQVRQNSDTVRLGELVVTATRLETPIADAPGSVTVLHGERMRDAGHVFLADALRAVPGVSLARSAGPGALTSVFVRGGESDYVQVLVDGVQVNDPGGSFDWAHLRTENIERVEIVRGPASVLYGSDAVSGVIQVFTRVGGTARIQAGVTGSRGDKRGGETERSYDTGAVDASLTGSVRLNGAGALLKYGLSGTRGESSGLFPQNSDYGNTNVGGRIALAGDHADAAVTLRLANNEYHYPTNGSGQVVDTNQFSTGETRSFGFDAGLRLQPWLELRTLTTLHDTESRTDTPPEASEPDTYWSTTDQLRRSIDARANIALPLATVLTLGAEREWQDAQTAFESVSSFGTSADQTDHARTNTGWYAQVHGTPIRSVSLTAGARIDDNQEFGVFTTARVAAGWRPVPALRVHASYGTSFKEPTFYENFATAYSRGNPDLEPEQARSGDAGAEYVAWNGALVLGATWFEQHFENLIQYTFTTPSPDAPNYYNMGAARARGVELTATAASGPSLVKLSYTRAATRVTDEGFGEDLAFQEGGRMLRRPTHQAAVNATIEITKALDVLLDARYVGDREDLDFTDPAEWSGVRRKLSAYGVVDAGVSYGIALSGRRSIDVNAGVRNMLDTDYEEIYNFPTAGRVLYLGLRADIGL